MVPVATRVPTQSKLTILQSPRLQKLPWLVHGFSTRQGGYSRVYGGRSLNLRFTKTDSKAKGERKRAQFLAPPGAGARHSWPLATLRQTHSDIIHAITKLPDEPPCGDGLLTNTPGLLLALQTADCPPV